MSMTGVGIDIIEITRVARACRGSRFRARVFTPRERDYIAANPRNADGRAAGIFAAKEALAKALGCGLSFAFLQHAEMRHDANGAPYFVLSGDLADAYGALSIKLSISHCRTHATAIVICEEAES